MTTETRRTIKPALCEVCGIPALIVAPTVGRAWCYWHRTDPQNHYEGSEERQIALLGHYFRALTEAI